MTSRCCRVSPIFACALLAVFGVLGIACSNYAADGIAGTATLSGHVSAEQPFAAAQVYALNHDKRMLYTVYTNRGRYKTINLMPGGYEIWAEKGRLKTEHKMMRIQAGAMVTVNLSLSPGPEFALTSKDRETGGPQFGQPATDGVVLVPYDELYPAGAGRDIAEATCIQCHGQTFLPTHQKSNAEWLVIIDVMLDPRGAFQQQRESALAITAEEREILADYLASNFGPDGPARGLKIDVEYPLDEEILSRGQFIEYLLPLEHNTDLYLRSKNLPGRHRLHETDMDYSGNIWATNGIIGVSRVDPRTAQWSHFPYGTDTSNPEVDMYGVAKGEPESVWSNIFGHGMIIDSQENVYWMEYQGQHVGRLNSKTGKVDRFHMDPEHMVVDERGVVGNIRGHSPDLDSRENVWFTAIRGNKIGVFERKTEEITLWEIPTPHSFPYGIEVDQNDDIWVAELLGCKIAKFSPRTEEFTEYPSLTSPCAINRIMADSKGTIWYSVARPGKLGRLDPESGEQTEYDILPFTNVSASSPYGIIADRDDQVWFGDGGNGGALVKFDPDTEEFTYYPLPRQTDNPNLDTTRDGAIIYSTRASRQAAIGIFYPDVSNMREFGAYR